MKHPSISALSVAFAVLTMAGSALADMAPPEDFEETCTVEQQQGEGETCIDCQVTFEDFEACINTYEPEGYTKRCKSWGASVYTEVFCKAGATGAGGATGSGGAAGTAGTAGSAGTAGASGAATQARPGPVEPDPFAPPPADPMPSTPTTPEPVPPAVTPPPPTPTPAPSPTQAPTPTTVGPAAPAQPTTTTPPAETTATPATVSDGSGTAPGDSGTTTAGEGGCSVSAPPSKLGAAWLLLVGVALAWRRRR